VPITTTTWQWSTRNLRAGLGGRTSRRRHVDSNSG